MTAFGAKREAGHSGKLEEGRDGLKYNRSSAPSDDQPNAGPNRLHFRIPVPCASIRHTKAALSQKLRWPQNSNASQVASARHTTQTPPFLVSNSPGNTCLLSSQTTVTGLRQECWTFVVAARKSRRPLGPAARPCGLTVRDPRRGSWHGLFGRPVFLHTTGIAECCLCAPAFPTAPAAMTQMQQHRTLQNSKSRIRFS
jgi:hypothetical protein